MKPSGPAGALSVPPARPESASHEEAGAEALLEKVLERENRIAALHRVEQNRGAPGMDGVKTEELRTYLRGHWERIREELLAGTYRPSPVRRLEIPKPGGGTRRLDIPTVVDRFIQQALLQVITPVFGPGVSEHSYDFRPGRRGHDAVRVARRYSQEGYNWVVDMDLEKFFDHVNHDVLMARVARKVKDKRVLRLIRRYLESGVMAGGVKVATEEGTPQGGPWARCWPTPYWTTWTRNLSAGGTGSYGMRTTATFTSGASGPVSE